jgi:methylenetetrahydrofolate--tRNA-(uracil-5-)-methyltransferase
MKKDNRCDLIVIGGGLAGCEAAWQAANRNLKIKLFEMRPSLMTGAHETGNLAELVCSNSLGSNLIDRASGLLKEELRICGSLLMKAAEKSKIPAGNALAVDRNLFSQFVESELASHPNIEIIREEVKIIPEQIPVILASGPLTSKDLSESIQSITGKENLFFYDAIAPVITYDSINFKTAYKASRYGKGNASEGDYINCPFTKEEYYQFAEALRTAERIALHSFEGEIDQGVNAGKESYFEGCLPVEVLANRNPDALAFGPMRPVGLIDPRTNKRPYAVIQLRQDNLAGSLYNIVGFQTNLKQQEQNRVFHMIPGLENAVFERYGQMHRNTYIASPGLINEFLQLTNDQRIFFAGQLSGVEGYVGNIASGLAAGINASALIHQQPLVRFPDKTMIGALLHYISHAEKKHFQPMKANFGILPPLDDPSRSKQDRGQQYSARSLETIRKLILP